MVDNSSVATNSSLQAVFSPSSSSSLPLLVSASSGVQPGAGVGVSTGGVGSGLGSGMKLEAVMENLQRQQAARLALEEKLRHDKEQELRCLVESRIHQQALAIRHYQAAVRAAAGETLQRSRLPLVLTREPENQEEEEDDEEEDEDEEEELPPSPPPQQGPTSQMLSGQSQGPSPAPQPSHHEWTYEEQFKQLYELDDDPKRKEFLDDLFSFMQKRGTPVNRIPIMAKQVLDLYTLYRLVTEKGGLVEVINKKIWREITKGLNLPTSITSAAFTLRTQYMKYLYPYECEKQGLSSPGELQAAIDSNRREGRRQSFGSTLFSYSPVGTPTVLSSPKIPISALTISTHNGNQLNQLPTIKKEECRLSSGIPNRIAIPVSLTGHHVAAAQAVAVQAAAAQAAQAAALEQLREKLESGEPPEKKMALMAEEQQRLMQHALQQNLLAMASQFPMNIRINNRDDRQETALNLSTNSISSINMSIEINGMVYTGVLFARRPVIPTAANSSNSTSGSTSSSQSRSSPTVAQNQPPSSHGHTPTTASSP
ncbi:AT-rich interactive domain-containing protein 3C [Microcaecilia unicolor]|uniref:AT-rich interactive domain-containing protein 3 n=1 Tax=Microcaecilia unicolor TaxID=1415580 RepID=A0A6P7XES8_9AMPH|nr:AT-rich interactive domain-containing protein 3C [Microcaecilia unicolor]